MPVLLNLPDSFSHLATRMAIAIPETVLIVTAPVHHKEAAAAVAASNPGIVAYVEFTADAPELPAVYRLEGGRALFAGCAALSLKTLKRQITQNGVERYYYWGPRAGRWLPITTASALDLYGEGHAKILAQTR